MKRYVKGTMNIQVFNNNQSVGSSLKTYKGSIIKRSKYGVGKSIGGDIYLHKDYALDVVPEHILHHAEDVLHSQYPDFEYNCIRYSPKTYMVSFQEAPDFDTAREPIVGDYVTVDMEGNTRFGHSNYIWHHKWLWVKNDYSGFDVSDSWNWSKKWLNTLKETADGNGISRWNSQLAGYGLPLE